MKIINRSIFVCIFFVIIASILYAVDDNAVLQVKIREALQYEQQGNNQEAERLYKQLLENFPHNRQVISRLVYLYFRKNYLDKLEELLKQEKEYLSQNYFQITQIELFIKKNELDNARYVARNMLSEARVSSGTTRQIAQLYQRYNMYDDAVALYLQAREKSNTPELFAEELAGVYQALDRPYDALDEYLKVLNDRTYKNTMYRIEKLDLSYDEILKVLKDYNNNEPSDELKQMIGEFYVLSKQYQKAYELYRSMGNDALIQLATLTEKLKLYDLSIQCFSEVLVTTEDFQTILYLENKIGELYYLNNDHLRAYEHYKNVIDLFQNTTATLHQNLIFIAYKNLALIELFENQNPVKSQLFLEKALHFASINNEKASLSIMLSECYLQQKDYVNSEKTINEVLLNKHYSSVQKEMAKAQLINTKILKGDFAQADTLAKDFLTHDYESLYVNDIAEVYRTFNNELNLSKADDDVKEAAQSFLYNIYFNNFENLLDDYHQLSTVISDSTSISYIGMIIADHLYEQADYENSSILFNELLDADDSPFTEYMMYRLADCMLQLSQEEQAAIHYTNYLLTYPHGTYAPEIRLILKKYLTEYDIHY